MTKYTNYTYAIYMYGNTELLASAMPYAEPTNADVATSILTTIQFYRKTVKYAKNKTVFLSNINWTLPCLEYLFLRASLVE